MDRKSILAMILIAIIIILWPLYNSLIYPPKEPLKPFADSVGVKKDTLPSPKAEPVMARETKVQPVKKDSIKKSQEPLLWKNAEEKSIAIQNSLYKARLSNRGGGTITQWMLNRYLDYKGDPVSFIHNDKNLNVSFKYRGQIIHLNQAVYEIVSQDTLLDLTQKDSSSIQFLLRFDESKAIRQTLIFYKDEYHFTFRIQFENFGDDITNNEYQVQWVSGLIPTEKKIAEDLNYFRANVMIGSEDETFDISTQPHGEVSYTGITKWISTRTKYFVVFIIPGEKDGSGSLISAVTKSEHGALAGKDYFLNLNMKFENNKTDSYTLYIGPTEYTRLTRYEDNLAVILEWGWAIIRPLSKGIFYIFRFLYEWIPNYGIVIIIFALLVKIILYPLTHKSYVGMQKMKEVMPRQKEIQKKYKDNPRKAQEELMKLYKEIGYNPLSGCLPVLLQMPILFPIYQVFNATIDLRQQPFVGWIKDLSQPDTVAVLHTGLPLIGDFNINPLPIIMTILTFVQQKITPMTPTDDSDPAQRFNQKFMLYGMPILFFFIFNNFSSGLVMYWTVFNVLTMLQQYLMSKHVIK